jgi:transcriptional regulator GlxA family with amidase domain
MRDPSLLPTLGRLVQLLVEERQPEVQACLLEALLSKALLSSAPFSNAVAAPAEPSERAPSEARTAKVVDSVVQRALSLMRADVARRWTVQELAQKVGVSRAALARRFARALGEPPQRWLTRARLEQAALLLAEGDDALAAVAAAVGYDSEFAFSRAFRRHFSVAPGAYRRRLHAGSGGSGSPIRMAA